MTATKTTRLGIGCKMAAASARQQVRFYFFTDPLKRFKVNVAWASVPIDECRAAARVAVCVCRIVESIVNQVIREMCCAGIAGAHVVLALHEPSVSLRSALRPANRVAAAIQRNRQA